MSDKKKKILIVHNYYQIPGGEDTVVKNEKRLLEEHGHEVILYTRCNSELKKFSGLQKLSLAFSTVFNIRTYKEVRKLIKAENIDVVHVHNTLNLISPSVYYAAFSRKIPVVQTIHNFRLLCPGADFYRDGKICEECMKNGLLCAVKHSCYRNSRIQTLACVISTKIHRVLGTYKRLNYICLTDFNKEKLLQLKQIKESRVFVKPNFVEAAEKIMPYQERRNQFVYVGRLDETKGTDILVKAWELMGTEAPELLICGKGALETWCKELIQKKNLSRVRMLGFVPNEQAKKLIGESKALILPTQWYEGFPMTILEAYSMGTPVIGSDLGNTGSLVIEGKSGLKFCYNSPEALVLAVRKIENAGFTFDEEFITKYSVEENYRQLRKIYETCCNYNEYTGAVSR